MDHQHFHIKNMVCSHCGEVLREKLDQAGFPVKKVELGEVTLQNPIDKDQQEDFTELVRKHGFDVINDQNSRLVEQIKQLIIQLVRTGRKLESPLSDYLAKKLHKDYQQLSRLFSGVEGKSIERYYILQKIERAKELIVYGEQSLSEIAYNLGYSSQQHFSRQFKKETGLSPSHFSEIKENRRISIDEV
ncbi:MAG: helix-turn-helix transcriptional regulator [Gracilimonas sp.]|uniref:helix-turn-helix domain-containing protein n=1 Tax=Gracilimonas sp. TaxID=1974203 RepID=UPI00198CAEE0|nr:AraC family transcriptional regulator [Gracilimonas sp.]MBD3617292.1 helix-turn-helix transcriptional regulator [Gracilimonas sp.]